MTCFRWMIRNEGPHINPPFRLLEDALRKAGGQVRLERTPLGICLVIKLDDSATTLGRKRAEPKEDLTIAQIYHARFMNVPMTEIAHALGVSVRTLHRRWKAALQAQLPSDTPYSMRP